MNNCEDGVSVSPINASSVNKSELIPYPKANLMNRPLEELYLNQ